MYVLNFLIRTFNHGTTYVSIHHFSINVRCNENNFTLFFSFRFFRFRLVETICTNNEQWFGDILLNLQFDSTWKFDYCKKLSIAFITTEKKKETKMKNNRMYFSYILVYLLEAYVLSLENVFALITYSLRYVMQMNQN